ncbi:fibronectin type III domain-containing protein [Thermophagus sp. OGC60D27]|uniref:fibronectin type III domain-containing protein n=1 Tax=Thermophagus sp. OGC60D27 TaxID=3458415 RepID=UPI0040384C8F
MNTIFKYLIILLGTVGMIGFYGCSDDIDPEITDLELSRLFSPTNLEVRVINQTSVRLTWDAVNYAESYEVEFYENGNEDFAGTPVKTKSGLTMKDLPYLEPGFRGDTEYSVRVKAVAENIADSKWVSTAFETGTEQIFYDVDPDDLTHNSVILRWPPGEVATTITIAPGNLVHNITDEEIAEGAALIEGLSSETDYVAVMKRDNDTRGTISFRTLIDLGGAIQVFPEDDLVAIIDNAEPDDAFALMPGEYVIDGNIGVSKTVSLKGVYPNQKPVIKGAIIRMSGGAGLELRNLILDGSTSDGNQTIIYDEELSTPYGKVVIDGCEISNYTKGVFYASKAVLIESVSITNTIYSDIECNGGDFIDFRGGMTKKLDFINNTVYNSAADRDLIRMDDDGSDNFPGNSCVVTFENNTLYNVINKEGTTRRIMYVRHADHSIFVRNNLFSNVLANYSRQSQTNIVEFDRNNYHNSPNLYDNSFPHFDGSTTYLTVDPEFADPANADFTVSQEDIIFYQIGDRRWIP